MGNFFIILNSHVLTDTIDVSMQLIMTRTIYRAHDVVLTFCDEKSLRAILFLIDLD